MKNLLISGLGGSLFPYLHNSLQGRYNIYYVDADETLSKLYTELNFFPSPWVSDPQYWVHIKQIISSKHIQFYAPLIDEEIVIAKKDIEDYNNVHVISPSVAFAELCINKFNLMNRLSTEGISYVPSYMGDHFNWELKAPIFVKPVSGRGSRGIHKITSIDQLEAYYLLESYTPAEIIIQPLLNGIEYTVGVLTNNFNDLIAISSKRIIRKKGITQMAITENNPVIDSAAKQIVEKLNPCGPFNIQLILTPDNEIKIFEINPRFSTTTIMEYEGGLDLFSLYIENLNKNYAGDIQRPKTGLILHRRWENLFYDAG